MEAGVDIVHDIIRVGALESRKTEGKMLGMVFCNNDMMMKKRIKTKDPDNSDTLAQCDCYWGRRYLSTGSSLLPSLEPGQMGLRSGESPSYLPNSPEQNIRYFAEMRVHLLKYHKTPEN